jgi:ABC-type antimicrobial peptide transport system permease subunit
MSEVAVMRTLGFSRLMVGSMLFGECGAIGLIGGFIGGLGGLLLFRSGVAMNLLGSVGALWVTPLGALSALAAAIAVCLLSGLGPIWTAIRTPPSTAFGKVV